MHKQTNEGTFAILEELIEVGISINRRNRNKMLRISTLLRTIRVEHLISRGQNSSVSFFVSDLVEAQRKRSNIKIQRLILDLEWKIGRRRADPKVTQRLTQGRMNLWQYKQGLCITRMNVEREATTVIACTSQPVAHELKYRATKDLLHEI